jgi:hypothetical protein
MAFFKGMEEANKLLPSKNDSKTLDHDRVRKKRLQGNDDVDVGMGRSSKQHGPKNENQKGEGIHKLNTPAWMLVLNFFFLNV